MWETFQLLGERAGGVSREGDSLKQDDYVKSRIWREPEGKSRPVNTQVDQRDTYFAVDSSSYFVFRSKSSA